MTNYIQVKLKYERVNEEGKVVKSSQTVLVDALSFTEAEAKTIEKMKEYLTNGEEMNLLNMKHANYSEVFVNLEGIEGSMWFEAVVKFEHETDKGDIRVEKQKMLIPGDDIQSAKDNLVLAMKGTLMEYTIGAIKETNITEVFTYEFESL